MFLYQRRNKLNPLRRQSGDSSSRSKTPLYTIKINGNINDSEHEEQLNCKLNKPDIIVIDPEEDCNFDAMYLDDGESADVDTEHIENESSLDLDDGESADVDTDHIENESSVDCEANHKDEANFDIMALENCKMMTEFQQHIFKCKGQRLQYETSKIRTLIAWSYYEFYHRNIEITESVSWTHELFNNHLDLVYKFVDEYLGQVSRLKSSTIYQFIIGTLQDFFHWYADIRHGCGLIYKVTAEMTMAYERQHHRLKRAYQRLRSKEKPKKTIDSFLKNRRMLPGNALMKHIQLVKDEYDKYKHISHHNINRKVYLEYLQCVAASFFLTPQGRNRAIENLEFQDLPSLLSKKGFATSEKFKTQNRYGKQSIILGKIAKKVLKLYCDTFRPIAARNALCHSSRSEALPKPRDRLLLGWDGEPLTNFGSKVNQFFLRVGNVNVTSTCLRALMETNIQEHLVKNKIDESMATDLSRQIGHSRETAQRCYVLTDNNRVVKNTKLATRQMGLDPGSDSDSDNGHSSINSNSEEIFHTRNWGIAHPSYLSSHTRIKFSKAELKYLVAIAESFGNKALPSDFVKYCHQRIIEDDDATPIFHERHTLKAARLRSALKKLGYVK